MATKSIDCKNLIQKAFNKAFSTNNSNLTTFLILSQIFIFLFQIFWFTSTTQHLTHEEAIFSFQQNKIYRPWHLEVYYDLLKQGPEGLKEQSSSNVIDNADRGPKNPKLSLEEYRKLRTK